MYRSVQTWLPFLMLIVSYFQLQYWTGVASLLGTPKDNYSSSGIIFLRIGAPGKNFMMCSADALKPQLGDKLVFQRGAVSRPAVASSLLSLLGRLCSAFAFVRLGQRDISPL